MPVAAASSGRGPRGGIARATPSGGDSTVPLLRTLGGLELVRQPLSRPKPLVLLAYLALEGPTPRRTLADIFFADAADPADALSTALRRLARIPGTIEREGRSVAGRVRCDTAILLDQLEAGALDLACEGYGGSFMAGLALSLPAPAEAWLFAIREYVDHRVLDAHLRLGDLALAGGDDAAARQHARAAFDLCEGGPGEPEVADRLYRLLRRTGHPRAAEVLRGVRDLIGEPQASPADGDAPPDLGPPRPGQIINREPELDAVARTLLGSEARLVTLHGPGGVGKTRVAQELIHSPSIALLFGSARAFVPLETVPSAELVPAAIAARLGVDLQPGEDPWSALVRAFGSDDRLVVLDGWERHRAATPGLSLLLSHCHGLRLLVTSRERLQLPTEWALTLKGLALPTSDHPKDVRASPAVRLLLQHAKRHDLRFELEDAALGAAARICRAVDGLPLGIALAAATIRGMPLEEIADSLERDPTTLETPNASAEDRHGSLLSVLASSWVRLRPHERRMLQRMSVFPGSFRREAASAVAGATLADLVGLLDASWLSTRADGRFEQHTVLRRFAFQKLSQDPGALPLAEAAHSSHYLEPLASALAARDDANDPGLLAYMREEAGNLLLCLRRATSQRDASALVVLAQTMQWSFAMRGQFRDADRLFGEALEGLPQDEPELDEARSLLLAGRAWSSRFIGDIGGAAALGRQALGKAEASGSEVARFAALDALGQAEMLLGANEDATQRFEAALLGAHAMDDPARQVRVLEKLVYTRMALGDLDAAAAASDEALRLVDGGAVGPSIDAVATHLAAGILAIAGWRLRTATEHLDAGLELARRIDHAGPIPLLLASLALSEVGSGLEADDADAVALGNEHASVALELASQRGDVTPMAFAHGTLARVAIHAGRVSEARAHLRAGIGAAWRQGNRTAALWAIPWQVELHEADGDGEAAADLAAGLLGEPGTPPWVRSWLTSKGYRRRPLDARARTLDAHVAELLRPLP